MPAPDLHEAPAETSRTLNHAVEKLNGSVDGAASKNEKTSRCQQWVLYCRTPNRNRTGLPPLTRDQQHSSIMVLLTPLQLSYRLDHRSIE